MLKNIWFQVLKESKIPQEEYDEVGIILEKYMGFVLKNLEHVGDDVEIYTNIPVLIIITIQNLIEDGKAYSNFDFKTLVNNYIAESNSEDFKLKEKQLKEYGIDPSMAMISAMAKGF